MRMGISRRLSCAKAHDIIMSGANYNISAYAHGYQPQAIMCQST